MRILKFLHKSAKAVNQRIEAGETEQPPQRRLGSWVAQRSGMGHEDQFRPPGLSACCRLPQATFAGTHGNGQTRR